MLAALEKSASEDSRSEIFSVVSTVFSDSGWPLGTSDASLPANFEYLGIPLLPAENFLMFRTLIWFANIGHSSFMFARVYFIGALKIRSGFVE